MADVKMKSIKGSGGCSVHGKNYPAVNGIVTVPEEHVQILKSHGFELHVETKPLTAKEKKQLAESIEADLALIKACKSLEDLESIKDAIVNKDNEDVVAAALAKAEKLAKAE
jgi:hypothetical protein